jgi:hypothetical protein
MPDLRRSESSTSARASSGVAETVERVHQAMLGGDVDAWEFALAYVWPEQP